MTSCAASPHGLAARRRTSSPRSGQLRTGTVYRSTKSHTTATFLREEAPGQHRRKRAGAQSTGCREGGQGGTHPGQCLPRRRGSRRGLLGRQDGVNVAGRVG
eukprot:7383225-Prymnesium_polylepis.3